MNQSETATAVKAAFAQPRTRHGYTMPLPLSLDVAVGAALMAKTIRSSFAYRGHEPRYLGRRAQARAAGYSNYKEQQALLAMRELQRKQEAERVEREQAEARMAETNPVPAQ